MLKKHAPKSFAILLAELPAATERQLCSSASQNETLNAIMFHKLVESLDLWASPEEVAAFANGAAPQDHALRLSFLQHLTVSALSLGMSAKQNLPNATAAYAFPCLCCSTAVDGGNCRHDDSPSMIRPHVPSGGSLASLAQATHIAILHMALAVSVLNWQAARGASSARFLQMCAEEGPANMSTQQWVISCTLKGEPWRAPLPSLIGLIDNCVIPFPKAANTAATLIGLVVTSRPAASLSVLDPIPTVDCVFR